MRRIRGNAGASSGDDVWATRLRPHRLALMLAVVVIAIWSVLMTSALRGAALPDEATGTVLVVFPPLLGDHEAYSAIIDAGGGVLEKSFLANAWMTSSDTPGFVGRLLAAGAWRAFDPAPIQPLVVIGCFTTPPGAIVGD